MGETDKRERMTRDGEKERQTRQRSDGVDRQERERGGIEEIDRDGRTAVDWLWAAGDMVTGPDVVHAVADGHRVAASIDSAASHGERSEGW